MKKLKFASIMLLATSIFLISCNSNDKEETSNDSEPKIELTISAAASLKESMAEIEKLYKEENPNVTLTLNFGSSGSLLKQIQEGAPSDIFISAGKSQMTTLEEDNLLLEGTKKNLVGNSLVLVGPSDTKITSLEDLSKDTVTKIALGEPSSVPAGKYATEVLTNLSILDKVKDKLIYGKDVKEVLTWAASGNAECGFVYSSEAKANENAKVIATIPENLHSPITYPIAVINTSKNQDAAKDFEDFLLTDKAIDIFINYGYTKAN